MRFFKLIEPIVVGENKCVKSDMLAFAPVFLRDLVWKKLQFVGSQLFVHSTIIPRGIWLKFHKAAIKVGEITVTTTEGYIGDVSIGIYQYPAGFGIAYNVDERDKRLAGRGFEETAKTLRCKADHIGYFRLFDFFVEVVAYVTHDLGNTFTVKLIFLHRVSIAGKWRNVFRHGNEVQAFQQPEQTHSVCLLQQVSKSILYRLRCLS